MLRQRKFDVVSAIEVGHHALLDRDQLAYAVEQQRTLLTFNEYYADGLSHYGIVVSPQLKKDRFSLLLRLILNMLNRVDADSMRNSVRFLQEFK
jgi:hypothetical protein